MTILYPPTQNALQKTLNAALLTGTTSSLTLNSVTGIQNKPGLIVVDRVDTNGQATASKREYITFTGVSGSTLTGLTRGLSGSTDQDHSVGAIVEFVSDVTQQQAILNLLDGTDTGAQFKTPKIDTSINDTNGNEVIKTPPTTSAVNEITVANAATGSSPVVSATGDDTNIDLNLKGKGTGEAKLYNADDSSYYSAGEFLNNDIYRQALINPGGDDPANTINQSGRFVGACNTWSSHTNYYGADGWLIYSSDATQMASDGDVGGIRAYRWNTSTATNKVAIMQIIEAANSYQLRGNVLTFGFVPTFLGGVNDKEDLTVFVLAMKTSGTADSVTNAPITSFGASGTRPTFDTTNYTVLYQADVSKSLIDGVYRVTGTTIAVPSDAKNIIFGVVNKDGFYNGGDVYAGFKINRCVLNIGSISLPFMPKSFSEELGSCMRFFEKSFPYTIAPAQNAGIATLPYRFPQTLGANAFQIPPAGLLFRVPKRATPTMTVYNPAAANAQARCLDTGTDWSGSSLSATDCGFYFAGTSPAGSSVGLQSGFHWTASCRL